MESSGHAMACEPSQQHGRKGRQPQHVADRESEHGCPVEWWYTIRWLASVAIERAGGVIATNVVTASNCQGRNGLRFLGLALPAKSLCDRFCQEWLGFHIVSEPLQIVFRDVTDE